MAKAIESQTCLRSGVLIGLHFQKMGQYRSLQKVTTILTVILVTLAALILFLGDGGMRVSSSHGFLSAPLVNKGLFVPSSPARFVVGHIGKVRIVAGDPAFVFPPKDLPESGFDGSPAPGVFESLYSFPGAHPNGAPSLDPNFGLPDVPPLWHFTERGLPAGIVCERIGTPAEAILVSPGRPKGAWLIEDTVEVEGVLTMHSYGLMSFELISETHPGRGFGTAVTDAISQGFCIPAVDKRGNRITVSCRYRCLFFRGGQPSVSVGRSITARIKKD